MGGDDGGYVELGRWLRGLRGELTQPALARRLGIHAMKVSKAENGREMSESTAAAYDRYYSDAGKIERGVVVARRHGAEEARRREQLGIGPESCRHPDPAALAQACGGVVVVTPMPGVTPESGQLTGVPDGRSLALPDGLYRVITSTGDVVVMAIDRRLFVAGAGLAVPLAGLEQTRHGLLGSLAADRAAADVDEWQQIAREYGLGVYRTLPAELLRSLQVDIAALGEALQRPHADSAKCELHKAAALLAAFTAMTVANLGDLNSARRWWRTAKQAADVSCDIQARLWTRGEEVVRALYERRPVPAILDLVAEAETISADGKIPPTAMPFLLCGKAQALALAGRAAAAESALHEVRDNFGRLPAHTTGDTDSWFGWSEHKVRFTESYVYSHLGDFARADQAQAAALALYPATNRRGPVKIKLQQALCLVRTGDVATGVEHAHTVMTGLPREQHDRVIVDLGRTVLDAVPAAERGKDGVREFRAYLGLEATAV